MATHSWRIHRQGEEPVRLIIRLQSQLLRYSGTKVDIIVFEERERGYKMKGVNQEVVIIMKVSWIMMIIKGGWGSPGAPGGGMIVCGFIWIWVCDIKIMGGIYIIKKYYYIIKYLKKGGIIIIRIFFFGVYKISQLFFRLWGGFFFLSPGGGRTEKWGIFLYRRVCGVCNVK